MRGCRILSREPLGSAARLAPGSGPKMGAAPEERRFRGGSKREASAREEAGLADASGLCKTGDRQRSTTTAMHPHKVGREAARNGQLWACPRMISKVRGAGGWSARLGLCRPAACTTELLLNNAF